MMDARLKTPEDPRSLRREECIVEERIGDHRRGALRPITKATRKPAVPGRPIQSSVTRCT